MTFKVGNTTFGFTMRVPEKDEAKQANALYSNFKFSSTNDWPL